MKPDYKNWVPRGLLFLLGGMAIICLALCIVFGMAGVATEGGLRIALGVLFGAAFLLFAVLTGIFANMYCAFSYNGKRKISKRVIEGIAQYVALSDGDTRSRVAAAAVRLRSHVQSAIRARRWSA